MPPKDDAQKTKGERWYEVAATKKGDLPVKEEKRPKGKYATIVSNVRGHEEALLKLLQERLGVGGSIQNGNVELQGRHQEKVEAFLKSSNHVKGARKDKEVVTPVSPEARHRGTQRSKGPEYVPPKPEPVLRPGKKRPPCWDWIYCSGQCLESDYVMPSDDMSDVYEEAFYSEGVQEVFQERRTICKFDAKGLEAGLSELGMLAAGPVGGYAKTTQVSNAHT
jgi:translation initiation factor 1